MCYDTDYYNEKHLNNYAYVGLGAQKLISAGCENVEMLIEIVFFEL